MQVRELKGMPVVNALNEKFSGEVSYLHSKGIIPKLAVVRVGENEDDLSYEKGIIKRFSSANAIADVTALSSDCAQEKLEEVILALNDDKSVHGILLFRPLAGHLSEDKIRNIILPAKDVDCMSIKNTASVFSGDKSGFPPCTPQAVIEILDYYGIKTEGKKAVIIGRSLVVGKPLAMLLLGKNATVTICHTRTANLADECKKADILIAGAGTAKMIKPGFVHSEQIVIDVGINVDNGTLCGDVDYDNVKDIVKSITPVPGGVGTVTTAVLLKHTIQSAINSISY